MDTIVVIMLKDKKTGFLDKELCSLSLAENEEYIINIFVTEEDDNSQMLHLRLSTERDVADWEYSAIFDYYDPQRFDGKVEKVIEIEDYYNPAWELVLKYSDDTAETEEVITELLRLHRAELEDVYNFVRQKLIEDHNNGKISDTFFNSVNKTLDTTRSYANQQTRMEEFVVECLTQPLFTEWLNNTQYDNESTVQGIKQSKKSILQKLMDILLNLFGIKDRKINDFSILAREYVILGKGNTPTTNNNLFSQPVTTTTTTANTASADNTNSPVERQPASPTAIDNQQPAINPATGENVKTITINDDADENTEDWYDGENLEINEFAATDLIENNHTTAEIYSAPIADGADISTFGVRTVNDMSDFVNAFPIQYRANIKQILSSNELNYTCS